VSNTVDVVNKNQGVVFTILNAMWNAHLGVECGRVSYFLGFLGVLMVHVLLCLGSLKQNAYQNK
jgi:hypothetical protein